ncbi:hypothetical protein NF867_09265 [Solitalea sp. MAHUQ-68]|uniref:Uncharacterized protein n=1 Tax=Solitalea agri TaxID=2953739 RepID=A0A9X2JF52_9SPHI|nr:hypothetical protein [Solitalea agri]MCO4293051.1 hypothetical protein [Solitalea agri]
MSGYIRFNYNGREYEREYECDYRSTYYILYSKGKRYTFRQDIKKHPETDGWYIEEVNKIPTDLIKIIGNSMSKRGRPAKGNPRFANYGKAPKSDLPLQKVVRNIKLAVWNKDLTIRNLLMMYYNGNPNQKMGYAEIYFDGDYIMGNLSFNRNSGDFRDLVPELRINDHTNSILSIALTSKQIHNNFIPSIGEQIDNPTPREGVDFSYNDC